MPHGPGCFVLSAVLSVKASDVSETFHAEKKEAAEAKKKAKREAAEARKKAKQAKETGAKKPNKAKAFSTKVSDAQSEKREEPTGEPLPSEPQETRTEKVSEGPENTLGETKKGTELFLFQNISSACEGFFPVCLRLSLRFFSHQRFRCF